MLKVVGVVEASVFKLCVNGATGRAQGACCAVGDAGETDRAVVVRERDAAMGLRRRGRPHEHARTDLRALDDPWCRGFCPWCGHDELRVGEDGLRRCGACDAAESSYEPARLAHAELSWLQQNAPADIVAVLDLASVRKARKRATARPATLAGLAEFQRTRVRELGGLWRVPALITEIEITKVRRGWHEGREMGFLTLEHDGRRRRVVIWPDDLAAYRRIFEWADLLVPEDADIMKKQLGPQGSLLGEFTLKLKWNDDRLGVQLKGCRGWVEGCRPSVAAGDSEMGDNEKATPSPAVSADATERVVRLLITIPLSAIDATLEGGDGDAWFDHTAELVGPTESAGTVARVLRPETSPYFYKLKVELEAAADRGDVQASNELARRREKRRRKRGLFGP